MTFKILTRRRSKPDVAPVAPDPAELYKTHFPRLFAYVRSCLGDDPRARDIIADSFAYTLGRHPAVPEPEFRLALFRTARRSCRPALKRALAHDDQLTPRERDILALTFDGQLTRAEVSRVCRLSESQVTAHLMAALKKLRQNQRSPAITAAYLKMIHP